MSKITFSEIPSSASSECIGNASGVDEHSLGFFGFGEESDPLERYRSHFDESRKESKDLYETYSPVRDVHYYGMNNGFNGSSRNSQPLRPRKVHKPHDFRISLSYAKPSLQKKVPEEPAPAPALDGSTKDSEEKGHSS